MKQFLILSKSLVSVPVLTGILAIPALSAESYQSPYDTQLELATLAKNPSEDQRRIIHGQLAMKSVTLDKNPIPTEPELLVKRAEEVTKQVNDLRSEIESLGDEAKKQLESQDKNFKEDWYVRHSIAVGYARKLTVPFLSEGSTSNAMAWEGAIRNYESAMRLKLANKLENMLNIFHDSCFKNISQHPDIKVLKPYYDILLSVIDVQISQQRRVTLKILLAHLKDQKKQ